MNSPLISTTVTSALPSAVIPALISRGGDRLRHNVLLTAGGVLALALLAQIAIPLSFTPVPVTGQTFGIALIALLFGGMRAVAIVAAYLALGAAGVPLFAATKTAATGTAAGFGPTSGYLIGMFAASYVMGTFADRGWTKTFAQAWAAALIGSVITFTCGLIVLAFFVPQEALLMAGLLPFIPGDLLKTSLAAFIVSRKSMQAGLESR
jgi:biotin transport system substrate-specific component